MSALIVDQHFSSEGAVDMSDFVRCANCVLQSASDDRQASLTLEQSANAQWIRCAQCRAGGDAANGR